jgi:nitrate reductase beta subunit
MFLALLAAACSMPLDTGDAIYELMRSQSVSFDMCLHLCHLIALYTQWADGKSYFHPGPCIACAYRTGAGNGACVPASYLSRTVYTFLLAQIDQIADDLSAQIDQNALL